MSKDKPVVVDGRAYHSTKNPDGRDPLVHLDPETGLFSSDKRPGYYPSHALLQNSGYMADFSKPVISQLQKWVDQGVLVHLNQNPDYEASLGPHKVELKLTIEPSKPRLWYVSIFF